jgi:hypothetical protein
MNEKVVTGSFVFVLWSFEGFVADVSDEVKV